MSHSFFIISFFIYLFMSHQSFSNQANLQDITLNNGTQILGKIEKSVIGNEAVSFKGIPYAKQPEKDRRWKMPIPMPTTKNPIKAYKYKNICPQIGGKDQELKNHSMSEQCLYLNIWRPNKTGKYPVIVWIHGGGFVTGAAQKKVYNGLNLSSKGIVFVSFNYRLNNFGFFAHPGNKKNQYSGNFGLFDQIMALQWIKDNIKKFGGNPENITIMGESAGALSVKHLLTHDRAEGLFHKAIMQSQINLNKIPEFEKQSGAKRPSAYKLSKDLAVKLNCQNSDLEKELKCMREKPFQDILSASYKINKNLVKLVGPFIDNDLFNKQPYQMIRQSRPFNIPIIIGSNKDEATYFGRVPFLTTGLYERYMKKTYGNVLGTSVLNLYPASNRLEMKKSYIKFVTDYIFGYDANDIAQEAVKAGNQRVYQYYFTRVSPGAAKVYMGASHGFEIPYFLNNLSIIDSNKTTYNSSDTKLATDMSSRLINFSKYSNPNYKEGIDWKSKHDKSVVLNFGDSTKEISKILPEVKTNLLLKLKNFEGFKE